MSREYSRCGEEQGVSAGSENQVASVAQVEEPGVRTGNDVGWGGDWERYVSVIAKAGFFSQ